jgi:hypothetical protein
MLPQSGAVKIICKKTWCGWDRDQMLKLKCLANVFNREKERDLKTFMRES